MSRDFDQYESSEFSHLFNYFDDILPAKTDFVVEAALVQRLMKFYNRITFERAQEIVHDIVHVCEHYTLVERI